MLHFSVHSEIFSSLCKRVKGAISRKDDQRYGRVKIVCAGGSLFIIGGESDYYTIISSGNVEIEEEGKVVVPAGKLFSIVGSGISGTIEVKSEGNSFTMKCGRSRFRLPAYGELAVGLPEDLEVNGYLRCDDLTFKLGLCKKFVNNDHYPFAYLSDGHISSTDGLSAVKLPVVGELKEPCVLSKRGVSEVQAALQAAAEGSHVWVGQDDAWTYLLADDQRIWVRKTSMSFPDLSQIFDKEIGNSFSVAVDELKSVMKKVSSVIGGESILHMEQKGDTVQFRALDSDGSTSWDALSVEPVGDIGKFRTSLEEFTRCLSSISSGVVLFEVGDREVRFVTEFGTFVISKVA